MYNFVQITLAQFISKKMYIVNMLYFFGFLIVLSYLLVI